MFVRLKSDPVKYTCMYTCLFIFNYFQISSYSSPFRHTSDTSSTSSPARRERGRVKGRGRSRGAVGRGSRRGGAPVSGRERHGGD